MKEIGKYRIVNDNDTGPFDETFREWWSIEDMEKDEVICECKKESNAFLIMNLLHDYYMKHLLK